MRKPRSLARLSDLLVLAAVALLNPTNPFYRQSGPPRIPDKVTVCHYDTSMGDTTRLHRMEAALDELQYFLRVHSVTDDGFDMVARYTTQLTRQAAISRRAPSWPADSTWTIRTAAKDRPMIAVKMRRGYWRAGHYHVGWLYGPGIVRDHQRRIVCGVWDSDTVVTATRRDSAGVYRGQMDGHLMACGQGSYDADDGTHYEGFWQHDQREGFGFESSPVRTVRMGLWRQGRFLGERIRYTSNRIYGIDISRHQHEKGRRRYSINWAALRITSLGHRHDTEGQTFPVSFVYIKATEGTTVLNRYFPHDYKNARKQGIRVGAYHFFSLKSPAAQQAEYFLRHSIVRQGDFPPVLDVEPTDAQIKQIGGDDVLMQRIRTFMHIVEQRTGMRPILYVSQMFINHHMNNAADIKKNYNVWIARYSQYKPDVRLVYWQLCPDGRVSGINGDVDINVFNGYQAQFDEFVRTGFHR